MQFATIEESIEEIQEGRMIIIVDDEDRENEGDLMIAAEKVTPEAINFMATHGRGLICLAMTGQRLEELQIPLMVSDYSNTSPYGTAFCVSIEARRNVSTGISAFDRAQTILTAIDPKTRPSDLARPGHIFPLRAHGHSHADLMCSLSGEIRHHSVDPDACQHQRQPRKNAE